MPSIPRIGRLTLFKDVSSRPHSGMDEPNQPVSGDGAAEQPFSCPECDRTVGRANVLTGDFAFENVTPISSSPDGSPEFRETGLDDGPQKAIELRCDHCAAEFTLGVETDG
ncbi:MAG: hypothetical protein BRD35_07585 [Bacteroidetes bacterium QH_7_62_13]|nr:MAG: hypothetical protein BRD35_07585 [Bacteroidetes bacterium QH_7_62_13]